MATSLRPFQSQTMARLMAGYRQVTHGAGRWLRQGRTAVTWGLQVVAYPLYAAVQGVRLGYRQLRAAPPWQRVKAGLNGASPPETGADLPIRALLSVLQPPRLGDQVVRAKELRLVNPYGGWLKQSQAGAVLTPGHWHRLSLPATVRGIASDLATQRLVLVTDHNSIFDHLTDDQHHRLGQAIALMLAEQSRVYRQFALKQHLQQPGLPLPKQTNPRLLAPLRWLPPLLRWMQTSPLAAATNLFGEAQQQTEAQARVHWHRTPQNHASQTRGLGGDRLPIGPAALSPQAPFPRNLYQYYPAEYPAVIPGQGTFSPLPADTPIDRVVEVVLATPRSIASASPPGEIEFGSTALETAGWSESAIAPAHASSPFTVPAELSATDRPQLAALEALEAKVSQLGYIDPPLVALLRGLDRALCWLETWLRRLGAWLHHHW
ncbi:hypothetical protein [Nodosilinea sp. E11]|uniref:hypothetical protein n=1 Tax=Nodosilinea sp. E11 TaxID=3037479 RepID=UPI00293429DB|nr:hypothetical protein [Nodosilinea sp. E11]WOD41643.1 hypothetical protein RRF56_12650 [Nodosilinea sp. E11]